MFTKDLRATTRVTLGDDDYSAFTYCQDNIGVGVIDNYIAPMKTKHQRTYSEYAGKGVLQAVAMPINDNQYELGNSVEMVPAVAGVHVDDATGTVTVDNYEGVDSNADGFIRDCCVLVYAKSVEVNPATDAAFSMRTATGTAAITSNVRPQVLLSLSSVRDDITENADGSYSSFYLDGGIKRPKAWNSANYGVSRLYQLPGANEESYFNRNILYVPFYESVHVDNAPMLSVYSKKEWSFLGLRRHATDGDRFIGAFFFTPGGIDDFKMALHGLLPDTYQKIKYTTKTQTIDGTNLQVDMFCTTYDPADYPCVVAQNDQDGVYFNSRYIPSPKVRVEPIAGVRMPRLGYNSKANEDIPTSTTNSFIDHTVIPEFGKSKGELFPAHTASEHYLIAGSFSSIKVYNDSSSWHTGSFINGTSHKAKGRSYATMCARIDSGEVCFRMRLFKEFTDYGNGASGLTATFSAVLGGIFSFSFDFSTAISTLLFNTANVDNFDNIYIEGKTQNMSVQGLSIPEIGVTSLTSSYSRPMRMLSYPDYLQYNLPVEPVDPTPPPIEEDEALVLDPPTDGLVELPAYVVPDEPPLVDAHLEELLKTISYTGGFSPDEKISADTIAKAIIVFMDDGAVRRATLQEVMSANELFAYKNNFNAYIPDDLTAALLDTGYVNLSDHDSYYDSSRQRLFVFFVFAELFVRSLPGVVETVFSSDFYSLNEFAERGMTDPFFRVAETWYDKNQTLIDHPEGYPTRGYYDYYIDPITTKNKFRWYTINNVHAPDVDSEIVLVNTTAPLSEVAEGWNFGYESSAGNMLSINDTAPNYSEDLSFQKLYFVLQFARLLGVDQFGGSMEYQQATDDVTSYTVTFDPTKQNTVLLFDDGNPNYSAMPIKMIFAVEEAATGTSYLGVTFVVQQDNSYVVPETSSVDILVGAIDFLFNRILALIEYPLLDRDGNIGPTSKAAFLEEGNIKIQSRTLYAWGDMVPITELLRYKMHLVRQLAEDWSKNYVSLSAKLELEYAVDDSYTTNIYVNNNSKGFVDSYHNDIHF